MPGERPRKTTQRLGLSGDMPNSGRTGWSSGGGEEVGRAEASVGGEDAGKGEDVGGGGGELGWKDSSGGRYKSSKTWKSATNSVVIAKSENSE